MGKKGVAQISGVVKPIVGETYTYSVTGWYPDTEPEKRNPNNVTWELFKQRSLGKFTTTNIRKKGISSFTFGEKAVGSVYKLQAYLYEPEGGGLIITPQPAKIPKIDKVELFYVDDKKGSTFSFMEKLRARAYCVNMLKKELVFTLWEDDAKGEGHNANNKLIETRKAKVNENGIAVTEFMLTKALMKKAMQGETDPKQLEFYVTVEYYSHKKYATDNVNINNPFPPIKHEVPVKPRGVPKAKGSPAASKPASKKEERGILENVRDWWKDFDLWDWGESSGTIKKDKPPTVQKPDGRSPAIVKGDKPKENNEICVCKQYDLVWGDKIECNERKKVVKVSKNLGVDPNWLMTVIALETAESFSPSIDNGIGYVGLIQFGKDAAKDLGTTQDGLVKMTFVQQMDYVQKFLIKNKSKYKTLTDLYLAVLYPSASGHGSERNYVVLDGKAYQSNPLFFKEKGEWEYATKVNKKGKTIKYKKAKDPNGKTYVWEITMVAQEVYTKGLSIKEKIFNCNNTITPKKNVPKTGDCLDTWDATTNKRIEKLHPKIRCAAKNFINEVDKTLNIKLRVIQGYRTYAEQNTLYNQGRTTKGKKVTNAKGGQSNHNFGLAIDVAEIKNGNIDWNEQEKVLVKVAPIGKKWGFEWGGDWKSFKDKPHFEMMFGKTLAELRKLYAENGNDHTKISL